VSRIYTRASWGARYRDGVATRPVGSLQKYLHHSVTKHLPVNATVEEEKVQCRVVEAIGQQRFGAGISYTFLVFPSGRIYQGASVNRVSYHSGGGRDGKPRNTLGVGICLVGNTELNEMTPQQVAAVVWLLQEGVRRGWWQDPAITEGHRDFKATSCPGRHAYKRIDEINRLGRSGKPVSPSKPTTPNVQEDDVTTPEQMREINRWIENIHKDIKATLPSLVAEAVWTFVTRSEPRSGWTMLRRAVDAAQATNAALPQIAGKVGASINTDELAAGLAEPLTEALAGSVSGEVVEAALRRVFADAANPNKED